MEMTDGTAIEWMNLGLRDRDEVPNEMLDRFDGATSLSWFWALCLGPIYFWAHGFRRLAVTVLILDVLIIGFVLAPFMARPAWRARAQALARRSLVCDLRASAAA